MVAVQEREGVGEGSSEGGGQEERTGGGEWGGVALQEEEEGGGNEELALSKVQSGLTRASSHLSNFSNLSNTSSTVGSNAGIYQSAVGVGGKTVKKLVEKEKWVALIFSQTRKNSFGNSGPLSVARPVEKGGERERKRERECVCEREKESDRLCVREREREREKERERKREGEREREKR